MTAKDEPFGKVIYAYTRAQAIEDGVLVDVSKMAKEAGFKYPTVITNAVYTGCVMASEKEKAQGQSESGRLWDLLWMAGFKARGDKSGKPETLFDVIFSGKTVTLKMVCSPGDTPEPVITIMLPEED